WSSDVCSSDLPTLFARASPRLDHHVYSSTSGFTTRKLSNQPCSGAGVPSPCASAINAFNHARSSGRQPEFFWLDFQLRMSRALRTMFQSPHRTYSRPLASQASKTLRSFFIASNLNCWRSSPEVPDGTYNDTTDKLPKRASM